MSENTDPIPPGISAQDSEASAQLLELVYQDLRQLARRKLEAERAGQTLQATALVHEAWLRLAGSAVPQAGPDGRAHFFAAAAEAMRRILIENARRKGRFKRGGGMERVPLDDAEIATEAPFEDMLALNEALAMLSREDPAKAELVKLRYFAGLSLKEAGEMLGLSPAATDRYWAFSRAYLYRMLNPR